MFKLVYVLKLKNYKTLFTHIESSVEVVFERWKLYLGDG
jgi:hypothetical protein